MKIMKDKTREISLFYLHSKIVWSTIIDIDDKIPKRNCFSVKNVFFKLKYCLFSKTGYACNLI